MLLWAPSRRSLALCLRPAGRGLSSSSSPSSSAAETAAPSAEVAESAGGDFGAAYARPASAEQSKRKIWTKTVTPWHARPQLVPAERAAVTAASTAGVVGQLAGIPSALLRREARIYRRARQATTSSSDKTKAWKIEFNHQREFFVVVVVVGGKWVFFFGEVLFFVWRRRLARARAGHADKRRRGGGK